MSTQQFAPRSISYRATAVELNDAERWEQTAGDKEANFLHTALGRRINRVLLTGQITTIYENHTAEQKARMEQSGNKEPAVLLSAKVQDMSGIVFVSAGDYNPQARAVLQSLMDKVNGVDGEPGMPVKVLVIGKTAHYENENGFVGQVKAEHLRVITHEEYMAHASACVKDSVIALKSADLSNPKTVEVAGKIRNGMRRALGLEEVFPEESGFQTQEPTTEDSTPAEPVAEQAPTPEAVVEEPVEAPAPAEVPALTDAPAAVPAPEPVKEPAPEPTPVAEAPVIAPETAPATEPAPAPTAAPAAPEQAPAPVTEAPTAAPAPTEGIGAEILSYIKEEAAKNTEAGTVDWDQVIAHFVAKGHEEKGVNEALTVLVDTKGVSEPTLGVLKPEA